MWRVLDIVPEKCYKKSIINLSDTGNVTDGTNWEDDT